MPGPNGGRGPGGGRVLTPITAPISEGIALLPAAPLRRYIDRYIGYRLEGFPAGVHRGVPSRHLTFIISLGEPIQVLGMPGSNGPFAGVLSGMHPGAVSLPHDGNQVGLVAEISPLGARRLFGLPAGPLTSAVVEPHEILGRSAISLPERLASASDWEERGRIMDEVFVRALKDRGEPPYEVTFAWRSMLRTHGTLPVAKIAEQVGWSRRHLSERFREEVGLSPKVAARVLRFERVRRVLNGRNRPALADVAAMCGYYDQSHLTRDFNDFAGCSPAVWIAEELPFVQDPQAP
ncbi:MAG: helix-turn-helix domain-containing protein [Actinomycetota bacterium]